MNLAETWRLAIAYQPRGERVFRIALVVLFILLAIIDVILFFTSGSDLRWAYIVSAIFIIYISYSMLLSLARTERRRRDMNKTMADLAEYALVPEFDAHGYAVLRAMETGEPVHMELRGGIWYENGKPLPETEGED